ncbi:CC chemokine with stalk CK2 precursor [Oncorhynchus mykiss]|uniref:CC chemokine with stalk CK2 n=2 Tax=Oncorhynchus mykiss TaxID=8022 RepID=Q8QGI9_ONCMY|nr:CC chemokine with stalk CK2 precursor [Oncorhynchus mykiss]AAM09300.1 CC chemokine with stalk CK2 [Oncorhynchus mykiss]
MVTCGTLVKIWTLAVVIAALGWTGTVDAEKLVSCCKTVSRTEVNDPITGYWIQNYNAPCVRAVIFETKKGLFCSYHKQPWVRRKIHQFEMARLSSTFLSLSIPNSLTSTSTPTTTSLPSSPPSSLFPLSSSSPSVPSSPPSLSSSPSHLLSSLFPASSSPPSISSSPPSFSSPRHWESTKNASTQQSTSNQ